MGHLEWQKISGACLCPPYSSLISGFPPSVHILLQCCPMQGHSWMCGGADLAHESAEILSGCHVPLKDR